MELTYDLHIHSCLSPCADDDMTPNNIVGLARLLKLDLIAVTDHNTVKNAVAAYEVGLEQGLMVLPGMELETAEEVHVVCLFPDPKKAVAFEKEIALLSPPVKNRPEIFGRQILMDRNDLVLGEEDRLLLTATRLSVDAVSAAVKVFQGAAFPAHIDRPSFSMLANLGDIPDSSGFTAVEISKIASLEDLERRFPAVGRFLVLRNSDAHRLTDISVLGNKLLVPEFSPEAVIHRLNEVKRRE
ncbi:PHP domain-containing protein [Papillibacter cinnamivorans]|uniref:Polymerase/histidinol phosphatase N-terminal domain-containing protein n=1 Tax=Papillibacter cinnamivorans DSM 12816 TaxID=1122930 RepID=A0A1W2A539_9FIRM|nr:PHP domain-containing protein [Papillibacter cinnamivorans]SMC55582.1 hypothetical protein SAMN02745168_1478 [Papillibacter cinnamivorans DSM 12816]